jgi:hypothetical protein
METQGDGLGHHGHPTPARHVLQHETDNCYLLIMWKEPGSPPFPFASLQRGIQSLMEAKTAK